MSSARKNRRIETRIQEFIVCIESIIGAFILFERQDRELRQKYMEVIKAGRPYREIHSSLKAVYGALPLCAKKDKTGFFDLKLNNGKSILDYFDAIKKDERSHNLVFHPNFDRLVLSDYSLPQYQKDLVFLRVAFFANNVAFLNALTIWLNKMLPQVEAKGGVGEKIKNDLRHRIDHFFRDEPEKERLLSKTKEIVIRRNYFVHNDGSPKTTLLKIAKEMGGACLPGQKFRLPSNYARSAASTVIEVVSKAFVRTNKSVLDESGMREIVQTIYQACPIEDFDLLVGFYGELKEVRGEIELAVNHYIAKKLSRDGLTSEDQESVQGLLTKAAGANASWIRAGLYALLDDFEMTGRTLLECFRIYGLNKNELLYQIETSPVFVKYISNLEYSSFKSALQMMGESIEKEWGS